MKKNNTMTPSIQHITRDVHLPSVLAICPSFLFVLITATFTIALFTRAGDNATTSGATASELSENTIEQSPAESPQHPAVTEQEQSLLASVKTKTEDDLSAAIKNLRKNIDENSSAALPYTLGVLYMRKDNVEKAVSAFRDALERKPVYPAARRTLADALLQAQRYEEAATAYRTLLQRDLSTNKEGKYWKRLGYLFLRQNKPVAAESAYRAALVQQPEDRDIREGLLQALLEQGRQNDTRWLIRKQLAVDPQRTDLWQVLVQQALSRGRTHDGLVLLECARRVSKPDEELLLSCADLYMKESIPALAFNAYEEAAQPEDIDKKNADRFLQAAKAFVFQQREEQARKLLAALDSADVDLTSEQSAERWYLKARSYMAEEAEADKIIRCLKKALRYEPLHGTALLHLGRRRLEKEEVDRAKNAFRRATNVAEFKAKALIGLARVATHRKNYEKAVNHLENSLQIEPDNHVRRYMEQIRKRKP